jgi:hypothetical protein
MKLTLDYFLLLDYPGNRIEFRAITGFIYELKQWFPTVVPIFAFKLGHFIFNEFHLQTNSVITNSQGPLKNVRYNRETL